LTSKHARESGKMEIERWRKWNLLQLQNLIIEVWLRYYDCLELD